jgi:ABC-type transporter Mla MlaB component
VNHLKAYPAHLALYLVGALDFLSTLPAAGGLAPYTGYITAAGVLAAALHHSFQTGAASAAVQAVASAPAKLVLATVALSIVLGASVLQGCTTLPTATQDAAITTTVSIATGFAIQQKDTDPKVWQTRATQIKLIALELKSVNDAGSASLATLAADLQPQIQKLGPADVIAVNSLVAALTPLLNQQIQGNPKVGNTQVAVDSILTAVLTTCSAYGA